MRSTFFGIELARRSLQAQQRALDVTGQNIANVNTPGYSRQETVMRTTNAYLVRTPAGSYSVGTGVEISNIVRMRDQFLDRQMQNEQSALGYWQSLTTSLEQVEAAFNEPSEAGLQKIFNDFWAAWQGVANNPANLPAREVLVEQSKSLTSALQSLNRRLSDLGDNLFDTAKTRVDEINTLTSQIASLNRLVLSSEAAGNTPNDLLDQRDLLLDKLAKLVPIQVTQLQTGVIRVSMEGTALVDGTQAHRLAIVRGNGGEAIVQWEDIGLTANLSSGELAALVEMQSTRIPAYRQKLSDFAAAIAETVNGLHQTGFGTDGVTTGLDFFDVTVDADGYTVLTLNSLLEEDPYRIAAANASGPGENALAIASALESTHAALGTTLNDFYRALVSGIGVETASAKQQVENQELLTQQIEMQRKSVSGVSLDEEMTKMIQYQQAYNAAARLVLVTDELLDTLINRLMR